MLAHQEFGPTLKEINSMGKRTSAALDRLQAKIVSRKLLVWLVATLFLVTLFITPEHWFLISLVYIGSEAAMNIVTVIRNAGNIPNQVIRSDPQPQPLEKPKD